MKKWSYLICVMMVLPVFTLQCQTSSPEAVKIFCWSLTPQTQDVIRGLEGRLGRSLPLLDAGGDYAKGAILINQLAAEKLQLLIVLGTQALTLTAPKIKKTSVVFAMVADPYHTGAAYIKEHPEDHQENITGIASPPPLAEAIRQTQKFFPAKKHWGLLYDPAEGPSVELKQEFTALAQTAGLTLTTVRTETGPRAPATLNELLNKGVQIVFVPPDQLSRHYSQSLAALGQARQFIVVNGNPRLASRGAVLSITLNYEAVGEQAGQLAKHILAGAKPKNIPISQVSPARVEADESLINAWAGYPPGNR